MSARERRQDTIDEHEVTALELFFDLVMVFAFTQVTRLLVDDPSWGGICAECSFSPRCGGHGRDTRG